MEPSFELYFHLRFGWMVCFCSVHLVEDIVYLALWHYYSLPNYALKLLSAFYLTNSTPFIAMVACLQ